MCACVYVAATHTHTHAHTHAHTHTYTLIYLMDSMLKSGVTRVISSPAPLSASLPEKINLTFNSMLIVSSQIYTHTHTNTDTDTLSHTNTHNTHTHTHTYAHKHTHTLIGFMDTMIKYRATRVIFHPAPLPALPPEKMNLKFQLYVNCIL